MRISKNHRTAWLGRDLNNDRGIEWLDSKRPQRSQNHRTVGLEGTSAPISPTPQPHTRAPQVQVGVELEANTRLQDTTFAFGYQLNLPQANVVFRGERGAAPTPLRHNSRSHLPPPPRVPPQGSWTVTGASGRCWRRSCPLCPSRWLWVLSSTIGRTVSTAASASSWAEGRRPPPSCSGSHRATGEPVTCPRATRHLPHMEREEPPCHRNAGCQPRARRRKDGHQGKQRSHPVSYEETVDLNF